jgi:hypothetical protein
MEYLRITATKNNIFQEAFEQQREHAQDNCGRLKGFMREKFVEYIQEGCSILVEVYTGSKYENITRS